MVGLSTATLQDVDVARLADIEFERVGKPTVWWDVLAVVALSALAAGLPLVLSWRTGSLAIPHNDDWGYRRAAVYFLDTGHLHQFGGSLTTVVGQLFWVWPFLKIFGVHQWVPPLSVVVLAVVGITAWYALCRRFLPRGLSVLAVAACLAFPGFALNTSTFMTDVPAWALDGVCLLAGAVALQTTRRRRWSLLALALAIGCFAFSVRDFSIAAPLAVVAVAWLSERRNRRAYAVAGGATLAVCAAIYVWISRLPGQSAVTPAPLTKLSILITAQLFFTFAFGLAPVVAWIAWRFRASIKALLPRERAAALVGLVVGIGAAALPIVVRFPVIYEGVNSRSWFVGNLLDQQGALGYSAIAGIRPVLFPDWIWVPMSSVAILSGIALFVMIAVALVRLPAKLGSDHEIQVQMAPTPAVVAGFVLLMGIALFAYSLSGPAGIFDRYLWPLLCPTAALLLRPLAGHSSRDVKPGGRVRSSSVLSGILGCLVLGASVAITLNADAFDAARWRAGEFAVAAGYKATEVDAGYEWVGDHSLENPGKPVPGHLRIWGTWYDASYPKFSDCAVVTSSPAELFQNLKPLGTLVYNEYWFSGPQHLYVYGAIASGCPPPPRVHGARLTAARRR